MLPTDPSPSKQKVVKKQRVLEWVQSSDSGVSPRANDNSKPKRKDTPKRKTWQDENLNISNPVAKKLKVSAGKSSKPMSPRKFYLPSYDETKAFTLPSTPESKRSATSGSLCFSPDKLDGIFIRKFNPTSSAVDPSDTDSTPASTPVKQIVHRLSCGLDSPNTDTTVKSSEKKVRSRFAKLGHRLNGKTPLQLYRESIKQGTRRVRNGRRISTPQNEKKRKNATTSPETTDESVLDSSCDATKLELEMESDGANSCSEEVVSSTTAKQVEGVSGNHPSSEDLDRSDNTLEDSSSRLVQQKLLPLFQRPATKTKTRDKDDKQMVIDAGQKNFDEAHQCPICRMIYTKGDPDDETLHKQFHSGLVQALKFTGWKKENIAERGVNHRVVYIDYDDPPHCRRKVQALKVILDQELGYVQEVDMLKANRRVYLYVSEDKHIKGVCIAESISKASKLEGDRASVQSTRASVGINRLWVYARYRRQGVATKLLDAVRSTFGMGVCLPRGDLAFSDPTSHGKMFAAKYTGTAQFLVYKP